MMDENVRKRIGELRNTIKAAEPGGICVNIDDGPMYVSFESIPIARGRDNIEDEFTQIRSALLYDIEQTVFHEDGSVDINMRRCPCCGGEIKIDAIDDFSFAGCPVCNHPIWINRHETMIRYNWNNCGYYTVHYLDTLFSGATDLKNRFVKCYDRRQIEILLDFIDKEPNDVKIVFHPHEPSI